MTSDRSCWTCAHQQIGGDTFLGLCRYFEAKGLPKKPIPPTVVDVGCKFWAPRAPTSRPRADEPLVEGKPAGEFFVEGM